MTAMLALAIDLRFSSRSRFRLQAKCNIEGIYGLYGPSGAGKSTLLRCIAGLPVPAQGPAAQVEKLCVHLGQRCLTDTDIRIPPEQRQIGMVFQQSRLFPFLTVAGNLQFAVQQAQTKMTRSELDELALHTGIVPLLDRLPQSLSGGESQRVALARTLASRPKLLLLDEPLSALDQKGRVAIFAYLKQQLAIMNIPALIVSHDLNDTFSIADKILYMEGGEILAQGTPADISSRLDIELTHRDAAGAIVEGAITGFDETTGLSEFKVGTHLLKISGYVGETDQAVRVRIPAGQVEVSRTAVPDSSILNQIPVQLDALVSQEQGLTLLRLKMRGGQFLLAHITNHSARRLALKKGDSLHALVKDIALTAL